MQYTPNINETIIKTEQEQIDRFYCQENPLFLIPDFNTSVIGILDSYTNYLKNKSINIDDAEFTETQVINNETGLTKCIYVGYDYDNSEQYQIEITGYIVEKENNLTFMATSITKFE